MMLCFCGFSAAGVLATFASMDWADIMAGNNFIGRFLDFFTITDYAEVENIRNSLIATAVSPYVPM